MTDISTKLIHASAFYRLSDILLNQASYEEGNGLEVIRWSPLRLVGGVDTTKRVKDSRSFVGHYIENDNKRLAIVLYGYDAYLDIDMLIRSACDCVNTEYLSSLLWKMRGYYSSRLQNYDAFRWRYYSSAYREESKATSARVNFYAKYDRESGKRIENKVVIRFSAYVLADNIDSVLVSES